MLEDEEEVELDEEEQKEFERKYSRRQLGSNADRYVEPEPELGSDGEYVLSHICSTHLEVLIDLRGRRGNR